jgi:hypothetical protein
MVYPEAAWERAMKVQEVIMKALTGELHWYRGGGYPRVLTADVAHQSETTRAG